MIKLIICDIGGVIERFSEEMYVRYICGKLGLDEYEFIREFMPMLDNAEKGDGRTDAMLLDLAKRFDLNVRDLEFASSLKRLAKLNKNVVNLLNKLHAKYKVALLTNVSRSRYLENKKIGLFKKVRHDEIFASCYMKMVKPDRRIYLAVLRKMKVRPSEAIFIDDRLVNIIGASRVGIHSIRFIGYVNLVNELKKRGVTW